MLGKLAKMPISMTIIIVWVIVWLLVIGNKNLLPVLGGKGIAQIGNQYYRFFSAGLTHKNLVHLIFNMGSVNIDDCVKMTLKHIKKATND